MHKCQENSFVETVLHAQNVEREGRNFFIIAIIVSRHCLVWMSCDNNGWHYEICVIMLLGIWEGGMTQFNEMKWVEEKIKFFSL